jgi:kynurenine formamidase
MFVAGGAAAASGVLAACAGPGTATSAPATTPNSAAATTTRGSGKFQDLTHTFSTTFPVGTSTPPERRTEFTIEKDGFYAQRWGFWEHTATHVDAPGHFVPGGRLVTELQPAELLFIPAVVIDISDRAKNEPDTSVTVDDITAHERQFGQIEKGTLVLMNSGWAARANNADDFRNADADGKFHFPGFSSDAADLLLQQRGIAGVGVDTLSIDQSVAQGAPVHHKVLGADRIGLECLKNLELLPRTGLRLFIGVVPYEQGSGGPCRVYAQT